MKYRIITLIGLAGSTLAVCFGGWDKFLQTLLLFMAIDWFTGGILLPAVFGKSPKSENGALESRAGTKVGLSDPVVPSGRAIAQRIKATPGITG